jgi:hypothetical protein
MSKPLTCLFAVSSLVAASCLVRPAFGADKKLTDDDRIEILRGLLSEYATVKDVLPRSPKPLPFQSDGTWDKQLWTQIGHQYGPAARLGDSVQITKIDILDNRIIFEINHGAHHGSWRDHVQVGMAGTISGGVSQIDPNQSTSAPGGTSLALIFTGPVPPLKTSELKQILRPILAFDGDTATENYVDTLPEPVQQAIKANKAVVGMTRDQVILALGKPRHKERNTNADGDETEDWVYGDAPGKITFVTFANSKVTRVNEAYADIGGSTASPIQVH